MYLKTITKSLNPEYWKFLIEIIVSKRGFDVEINGPVKPILSSERYLSYDVYTWLYAGLISISNNDIKAVTKSGTLDLYEILDLLKSDTFRMLDRPLDEFKSESVFDGQKPDSKIVQNFYPFDPNAPYIVSSEVIKTILTDLGNIILNFEQSSKSLYILAADTFPTRAIFYHEVMNKSKETDPERIQGKVNALIQLYKDPRNNLLPSFALTNIISLVSTTKAHIRDFAIKNPTYAAVMNEKGVSTKIVIGEKIVDINKDKKITLIDNRKPNSQQSEESIILDIENVHKMSTIFLKYTTKNDGANATKIAGGIALSALELEMPEKIKDCEERIKISVGTQPVIESTKFQYSNVVGTNKLMRDVVKYSTQASRDLLQLGISAVYNATNVLVGESPTQLLTYFNRLDRFSVKDVFTMSKVYKIPDFLHGEYYEDNRYKSKHLRLIEEIEKRKLTTQERQLSLKQQLLKYSYLSVPIQSDAVSFKLLVAGVNAMKNISSQLMHHKNISIGNCVIDTQEQLDELLLTGSLRKFVKNRDSSLLISKLAFDDCKLIPQLIVNDATLASRNFERNLNTVMNMSKDLYQIDQKHITNTSVLMDNRSVNAGRVSVSTLFRFYDNVYFDNKLNENNRGSNRKFNTVELYDFISKRPTVSTIYLELTKILNRNSDITQWMKSTREDPWDVSIYGRDNEFLPKYQTVAEAITNEQIMYSKDECRFENRLNPNAYFNLKSKFPQYGQVEMNYIRSFKYLELDTDLGMFELLSKIAVDYLIPKSIYECDWYLNHGASILSQVVKESSLFSTDKILEAREACKCDSNTAFRELKDLEVLNTRYSLAILKSVIGCRSIAELSELCRKIGYFFCPVIKDIPLKDSILMYTIRSPRDGSSILLTPVLKRSYNTFYKKCEGSKNTLEKSLQDSELTLIINSMLSDIFLNLYGGLFWSVRNIGHDAVALVNSVASKDTSEEIVSQVRCSHRVYIAHRATLIKKYLDNLTKVRNILSITLNVNSEIKSSSANLWIQELFDIAGYPLDKRQFFYGKLDLDNNITNVYRFRTQLESILNMLSKYDLSLLHRYYKYAFEYNIKEVEREFGIKYSLSRKINTADMLEKVSALGKSTGVLPNLAYREAFKKLPIYSDKLFDPDYNLALSVDGYFTLQDPNIPYTDVILIHKDGYAIRYYETRASLKDMIQTKAEVQTDIHAAVLSNGKILQGIEFDSKKVLSTGASEISYKCIKETEHEKLQQINNTIAKVYLALSNHNSALITNTKRIMDTKKILEENYLAKANHVFISNEEQNSNGLNDALPVAGVNKQNVDRLELPTHIVNAIDEAALQVAKLPKDWNKPLTIKVSGKPMLATDFIAILEEKGKEITDNPEKIELLLPIVDLF